MNIRNTIKAAIVALPLMFGHGSAAAQKITHTAVKDTARTTAVDTLKAMDNMAVDARTFVMNKADSVAKAKADSVARAAEDSIAIAKSETVASNRTKLAADVSAVVGGTKMPGVAPKVHVAVERGKNLIDVSAFHSASGGTTTFMVDGQYSRLFQSKKNKNLQYSVGAGASNTVLRDVPGGWDDYGVLSPRVTAGVRYKTALKKGSKNAPNLSLKAEAGPAANIKFVAQTHADDRKFKPGFYMNTEAAVGKKHWEGFVNAGHHPYVGFNGGVGVRYKF